MPRVPVPSVCYTFAVRGLRGARLQQELRRWEAERYPQARHGRPRVRADAATEAATTRTKLKTQVFESLCEGAEAGWA